MIEVQLLTSGSTQAFSASKCLTWFTSMFIKVRGLKNKKACYRRKLQKDENRLAIYPKVRYNALNRLSQVVGLLSKDLRRMVMIQRQLNHNLWGLFYFSPIIILPFLQKNNRIFTFSSQKKATCSRLLFCGCDLGLLNWTYVANFFREAFD